MVKSYHKMWHRSVRTITHFKSKTWNAHTRLLRCCNPTSLTFESCVSFLVCAELYGITAGWGGGTDVDVKATIDKARTAFLQVKNMWCSGMMHHQTKIRIINSCKWFNRWILLQFSVSSMFKMAASYLDMWHSTVCTIVYFKNKNQMPILLKRK